MSMNVSILQGRLTREPEHRQTANGVSCTRFTIAVDRNYSANGQRETDFINCVAWRNTADFVAKWFTRGQEILVQGAIQTRSYDGQDGQKRNVTEVVVDRASFCGKRADNVAGNVVEEAPTFEPIPDDGELPF